MYFLWHQRWVWPQPRGAAPLCQGDVEERMGNMGMAPGWQRPGWSDWDRKYKKGFARAMAADCHLQLLVGRHGVLTRSMNDWLFHVVILFFGTEQPLPESDVIAQF